MPVPDLVPWGSLKGFLKGRQNWDQPNLIEDTTPNGDAIGTREVVSSGSYQMTLLMQFRAC